MDPFLNGQYSMKVDGPFSVSLIERHKPDLNFGVAPIPTPTGDDFTTWSGGHSLIMPEGSNHPEEAWEFMKFFVGEEGQKIYSEISGDFSVLESVNEELFTDDPIYKEFIDILPDSRHRPVISEGQLLWNELDSARDNAVHGNGTPQELLDAVTKRVNDALN